MANITKEYLDKKFDGIDKKFGNIDKKFTRIDEQFRLVNKNIVQLRSESKAEFSSVHKKIEEEVANLAGMTQRGFDEVKRINVVDRVDRLERVMYQVAQAINIPMPM